MGLKLAGPGVKWRELEEALRVATEQREVEREISKVRAEVERQDQSIKTLTSQLKEAETLLASTVYQAKQKLENISRGEAVLSEDLIKFSHKISASNAVCAPLNWQQGDPRRPYPTDLEMRGGFLARAELPLAQQLQHVTPPPSSLPPPPGPVTPSHFSWTSGGEMTISSGSGPVHIET